MNQARVGGYAARRHERASPERLESLGALEMAHQHWSEGALSPPKLSGSRFVIPAVHRINVTAARQSLAPRRLKCVRALAALTTGVRL
jgi:hypothetical protein